MITHVRFTDEIRDPDREPAGPIQLVNEGRPMLRRPLVRAGPNDPWFTHEQALWLSEQLGVQLEVAR